MRASFFTPRTLRISHSRRDSVNHDAIRRSSDRSRKAHASKPSNIAQSARFRQSRRTPPKLRPFPQGSRLEAFEYRAVDARPSITTQSAETPTAPARLTPRSLRISRSRRDSVNHDAIYRSSDLSREAHASKPLNIAQSARFRPNVTHSAEAPTVPARLTPRPLRISHSRRASHEPRAQSIQTAPRPVSASLRRAAKPAHTSGRTRQNPAAKGSS